MRSKSFILIGGILLVGLVLSAFALQGQTAAPQAQQEQVRTISVSGMGEIFMDPDKATISIGVHTEHESASEAVEDNNAQIQKVVAALKDMGVVDKDIQTSNFSIYPQQQFDDQGNVTSTRYIVENTVTVTVRDLADLGQILDTAVSSGANSIYGIQFDVQDKTDALSQARQKAVEDAGVKAQELATAAGVTLGEIQSISEVSGFIGPVFDGRGGAAEAPVAAVPISPGQVTVSNQVTVVYFIQ